MLLKFPCAICGKAVAKNHRGVQCDVCNLWIHTKCNNTSVHEYQRLMDSEEEIKWGGKSCLNSTIPFSNISNKVLRLKGFCHEKIFFNML